MSLSLGEKLRQAREERGFTLSEVAEQTRISSLYLESIENDDYRILPGGIFNKGFVKSYAKFVGLNEQEALLDYSQLLAESEGPDTGDLKLYKPEVLTDDRSSASMTPTIIFAVVILALMTGGVLFLVSYLKQPAAEPPANTATKTNLNAAAERPANVEAPPSNAPDMATLRVEFKTLSQPVRLSAISDGVKSDNMVAAGSTATFEPKESLTLNYNRWNAQAVQLTINGKTITLPGAPLDPKDKRIEFTINRDNIGQIWTSGAISTAVPPAADANVAVVQTEQPAAAAPTPVRPTPVPKPSVNANTGPRPTPDRKPPETPKPAPTGPPRNRP